MVGRHHQLNGHEWACSESGWWTGKPKCCSPWGRKELDTTEPLNWTDQDRLCNCPQNSISLFSDLAELHFPVLLSLNVALYRYLPSEMWMVVMCFSFMARPLRKWLCSLCPFYFPMVDWNFNDQWLQKPDITNDSFINLDSRNIIWNRIACDPKTITWKTVTWN